MPVFRYRTLEAAQKALWHTETDHKYFQQVRNLFDLAARLNAFRAKRGVFKYRTFEEASRKRMEEELGNKGIGQN